MINIMRLQAYACSEACYIADSEAAYGPGEGNFLSRGPGCDWDHDISNTYSGWVDQLG